MILYIKLNDELNLKNFCELFIYHGKNYITPCLMRFSPENLWNYFKITFS